mmetsp:Transcript_69911/g.211505  ORF Transcript_69911/g.211505 Transcript_69911/m.211505 type:complete len:256 (+) Transcript_69911:470-1237(+)
MALRQRVEHLRGMASRSLHALGVCHPPDRVELGRVPEDAQPGLDPGAHDVPDEGPDVAHPELVGQDLVGEVEGVRAAHARQLQRLLVELLGVGHARGPQQGLQGRVQHAVTALEELGQHAHRLVLHCGDEDGHLVPPALGDELARLPGHGLAVDHGVPALRGQGFGGVKALHGAESHHAHDVVQEALRLGRGQRLRDPVRAPKLLRVLGLEASQLVRLLLAADPVDHEVRAVLVGGAGPHVRGRRGEDAPVEEPC